MDELKWMYASISRKDFQEKIAFAEKLLEKYGAEYVIDFEKRGYWTMTDGIHAYENIRKRIYKLGEEFIRVDWVYFTQKPFIVLEFSDKIDGPYEDADPFPYDLPDDEFEYEIRFSVGHEKDELYELLSLVLKENYYTLLLGLDGDAALGNVPNTYKLYDEEGNLLNECGEIEEAAYRYFMEE